MERKYCETELVLNIIDYIERAEYSDDYDENLFEQMKSYLMNLYRNSRKNEKTSSTIK